MTWRTLVRALALVAWMVAGGCAARNANLGSELRITASGRTPREIYAQGEQMLRRGNLDKAVRDFTELRNFHRDDPLSTRAELALAEIRFRKNEWDEARAALVEFRKYHPNFEADYVTWRIGYAVWKTTSTWAGRDQALTRAAVNEWTGFETRFPESEYVDEVVKLRTRGVNRLAVKEMFIARFYKRRGAWSAVAGRALNVARQFGASKHLEEALALAAEAYHRTGSVEAAQQFRAQLQRQFPESPRMGRVDRVLSRPPGTPPEDEIFIRPYRVPTFGMPSGGGPPR